MAFSIYEVSDQMVAYPMVLLDKYLCQAILLCSLCPPSACRIRIAVEICAVFCNQAIHNSHVKVLRWGLHGMCMSTDVTL